MHRSRSRSFDSASECLDFIRTQFAGRVCNLPAIKEKPDGGAVPRGREVIEYLFRGEDTVFPRTVASLDRLAGSTGLDEDDCQQIRTLSSFATWWFSSPESNFGLAQHEATSLVQHLRLPTSYIDFSSDPEVAMAFAACGSGLTAPKDAQVCVLNVPTACVCGQVAEFLDHPWCERARRQVAYGYWPIEFPNLKSPEAEARGVVRWFKFSVTRTDLDRFRGRYDQLLDASTDPVAGLLRSVVNSYVAEKGKLRPRVARYCVDQLLMVPMVARVVNTYPPNEGGYVRDVNFLPPCEHVRWDESTERECSLHYWSQEYTETLSPDYFAHGSPDDGNIFVFPATHHPNGNCLVWS